MDEPLLVEVELLAEDWAAIGRALASAGRHAYDDVPWLLEVGLDRFAGDEAEWDRLVAEHVPDTDPRRQELKRRETEALAVSMRPRTISAEMQVHALSQRVNTLADELEAHKRAMRALREENAGLEERLRGPLASEDGAAGPVARPREPLAWFRAFLGGRRRG